MRTLHFPPRLNYSMQALKDTNPEHHDILEHILEELAEKEFGLTGDALQIHKKYTDHMLMTGLLKPVFVENENGVIVYFQMWSFFKNKYVEYKELEYFEKAYADSIFTAIFSVN